MRKTAVKHNVLPYEVIEAAVHGDPEAVNTVVRHYSGYIAALSTRKVFDDTGRPYPVTDEAMRRRLETRLIYAILEFDLN